MKKNILKIIITLIVVIGIVFAYIQAMRKYSDYLKSPRYSQQRDAILKYHFDNNILSVIEEGKKYLRTNPNDEEILIIVAENYMWSDDLLSAKDLVEKALEVNNRSAWALRILSEIYMEKANRFPEFSQEYLSNAKIYIDRALVAGPEDPYVYIKASEVYFRFQDFDIALNFANKAIKIAPHKSQEYFQFIRNKVLNAINESNMNE